MSEILDLTCRVTFQIAAGTYARLALWTLLPAFVTLLALRYLLHLGWWTIWLVALPLATVLEGPFTVAASRLMFSERLSARATLRIFAGRLVSYVFALLIKAFVLTLAILPLFIAVPIVWPNLTFVAEATLLEHARATEAWGRSKRLVLGRTGDALIALVSWLMVRVAFVGAAEMLMQGVVTDILQLGRPFGTLFKQGGTPYALLGLFLATPFLATARFLQYVDTRTRSDGWDLQVRFMAIAAEEERRTGRKVAAA